ncbi:FAD-dependent oxidoreductase [Streptomyces sp. WI04-05B]|uniref:FAD-dependent oxidoreductase n=1 Tax=Streptomyces TaxID=1883 RepID=UPI0029A0F2BB|nr:MULTISPECIES: FAD-dependent oxidoreductase [unclassified Streptomyces]MDX2547782.1 FAD-dependent oxidoreductase [Streptomyces sp. WI04-05B]MDX2583114.1 FAD-dependent oxidoreductase [Streptomyces sp. WI04-05A]
MIVVGGGVIGLTTAVVLAERGRRVRVWTRESAELTTSAVAGALWWPYRIEPEASAGEWALASLSVYEELAKRPGATGVRMVEGVQTGLRLDELGPWAARVPELRETDEGLRARLPLIDMPVHLGWLRERFLAAGGVVEERSVTDLAEVAAADGVDVVVNCTGLGARDLVPDPAVRPVRGQLVVVENPGITTWFTAAGHADAKTTYFFPQPGGLILGGTAEEDEWSLVPDPAVAEEIVRRCAEVRPEIAGARVIGHRVGLRPTRDAVRLEREPLADGRVLVHNYGHGGAGVTVAWGCASEVAGLVQE